VYAAARRYEIEQRVLVWMALPQPSRLLQPRLRASPAAPPPSAAPVRLRSPLVMPDAVTVLHICDVHVERAAVMLCAYIDNMSFLLSDVCLTSDASFEEDIFFAHASRL